MIQAINPSTEKPLQEYEMHSDEQVLQAMEKSNQAFQEWRNCSFTERASLMKRVAKILKDEKDVHARRITAEMGKTMKESTAEIEKCAWVCEYYAQKAEEFLTPEAIATQASKSYVSYQPLGTVLAIMPWNYPYWQLFRFAAPTLMAGNAAILKHAPNIPGCANAIASIFEKAGFPEGLFINLFITNDQVSDMINHSHIKAVTLTGSTKAGRSVAQQAGAALKKCVLELGGSDPSVVLEDADLELAVETMVASRLQNAGQSCISAKRFIVPKSISERFLAKLVEKIKEYTYGDPHDESVDIGPLVGKKYRDHLHEQVQRSIKGGATCLLGGEIPEGTGFYYPPTLLTGVSKGMPAYDEELFGPVASVIVTEDEEQALEVANDTNYGLGAAIFSADEQRAERLAATHLEAGCCFVNAKVQSDPRLPFGGIKESGFGRELSHHGLKEFVNAKTIYVK